MKRFALHIALLTLIVGAFAACSHSPIDEEQLAPSGKEIAASFFAVEEEDEEEPVSRITYDMQTLKVRWKKGDEIPVIRVGNNVKVRGTYAAASTGYNTAFNYVSHAEVTFVEGYENNFYSYYPWQSTTPPAGVALKSTPYQVQSKAGNTSHLDTYCQLKADPVTKKAGDYSPVQFKFTNMLSVVELTLKGDPTRVIDQVRLTTSSGYLGYNEIKLRLNSTTKSDRTSSPITITDGSAMVSLSLSEPAALSSSGIKCYLTVLPGQHANKAITLTAYTTDGAHTEVKMKAINFEMNHLYRATVTLDDWVEAGESNAPLIEVRGNLIDIRRMGTDEYFYPQHKGYPMPTQADQIFPRGRYAIGLEQSRGPEAIRLSKPDVVYIASPKTSHSGWTRTGQSFKTGSKTFYLFKRECEADTWITVPYTSGQSSSPVVFGERLKIETTPPPGVIITRMPDDALRLRHITNVNIEILEDGSYLALCTNITQNRSTDIYRSTDGGESWEHWSGSATPMNFTRLFQHRGALYIMGTSLSTYDLIICKSTDKGKTWSAPTTIFNDNDYHQAPTSIVEHEGRLWRAMEYTRSTERQNFTPFAISANADGDLLDAKNWSKTTVPTPERVNTPWNTPMGITIKEVEEGNVVVGPNGELYNLLRANSTTTSSVACLARILPPAKEGEPYRFEMTDNDFITMPGGGKKFTIRFDEKTQRYWTLTNPATQAGYTHSGIYANGITFDLMRNRVALCYSTDLKHWTECATPIIYDEDPFFHGFQYLDWQFEGDDIVAVIRAAHPEERGLPERQHDANLMLFYRIKDFRAIP